MASKMMVFCGSDDPYKAFPAFMMGTGAIVTDMDLTMFFTMTGLNIIRKGGAEKIVLPNAPRPLSEFLDIALDSGAKLIACSGAFPIVGISEDDLVDGVECGGVAAFVVGAEEADVVLTFS